MSLLSLTSGGVSFLVDENDIVRVYSVNSETKVEYFKANAGTIDVINVSESLSTIDAASDVLIELTKDGIEFLLNSTNIRQVLTEGNGSKIIYEKLLTQSVVVEETPAQINALIVTPSTEPKRYKALLSQNAPVATTTDPTMVAGQIWELEAYNAADAATIAALELVSGTLYAVGSKYRSATNQTLNVNAATTFSYDGSPYIVSTDANGDFNPLVNTIGTTTLNFISEGLFSIDSSALFASGKTTVSIGNVDATSTIKAYWVSTSAVRISTKIFVFGAFNDVNDILNKTPFEIEVYP
jgi:hypothetical protein